MRRPAAFVSILLAAGCGQADRQQASAVSTESGLQCLTDGATDYATGCTTERQAVPGGAIFTLRSPTGSFRRLRVVNGTISAADGAEPARVVGGDARRVEVAIGRDRYRIPRGDLR
jgi:hypothetical protein